MYGCGDGDEIYCITQGDVERKDGRLIDGWWMTWKGLRRGICSIIGHCQSRCLK
jgi:hypothetical protein